MLCMPMRSSSLVGLRSFSEQPFPQSMPVPVIDLFAGPGGLGEGFSRAVSADFHVAVSIEKDEMAFETLRLRSAHRALQRSGTAGESTWRRWDEVLAKVPWNVAFDYLRESAEEQIEAACNAARREAWHLELGPGNRVETSEGIRDRLRPYMSRRNLPENSVLIGGPPCQAYSIVGRSRNRGVKDYKAENDHRHFLYREYLNVIAEFRPAVFVMENVKGILSSKVQERQLFEHITADLRRPDLAIGSDSNLHYELVALGPGQTGLIEPGPEQFIVEAESHGVPQARHRVVICGIRRDVHAKAGKIGQLRPAPVVPVRKVLADLPRLRCSLSYRAGNTEWREVFEDKLFDRAVESLLKREDAQVNRVAERMEAVRARIRKSRDPGTGADRLVMGNGNGVPPAALASWYKDRASIILANHEARAHMPSDLARYLFVSTFGEVMKESPRLADFPRCLLPQHRNIDPRKPERAIFKDRFRVQLAETCSMTVTSHIHKDGNAFIHYDPAQCRSLTVREAARLQTFPDSYVFLGNRTSQYVQVGNAVPPYLAYQIAELVGTVLCKAGLAGAARETTAQIRDVSLV